METADRRNIRILVAEDNPINQKVVSRMIKGLGHRADVAGNGLEVLDAIQRQTYDIVLMDVQMPEMDGLDATRKIRTILPGPDGPWIVAMTANAMHGDEDVCLQAGMDAYLAKPIRLADLELSLERWSESHPMVEKPSHGEVFADEERLSGPLAELYDLGGDELVAELMAEFQLQVESDLAEVMAAARGSDYRELLRLAHRLKGGSTTVGAAAVTGLCVALERAAAEQSEHAVAAVVERLGREVAQRRSTQGLRQVLPRSVRIMIADDHPVVRFGVRKMLQSHKEYVVVGEASNGRDALREMREIQPDILLLDLNMPLLPGLDALRELTTIQVSTRTILLTSSISQREILEALQLGARGVILKDALTTDLSTCIATVMQGHYWLGRKPVQNLVQVLNELMEEIKQPPANTFGLTIRELEVVRLIAQGLTNKEIARNCSIADETVKRHLKNIFDKVGVWNRLELALFAINNHLAAEHQVMV
jgi:DNA-binding NarL/FixJ family response regulator